MRAVLAVYASILILTFAVQVFIARGELLVANNDQIWVYFVPTVFGQAIGLMAVGSIGLLFRSNRAAGVAIVAALFAILVYYGSQVQEA